MKKIISAVIIAVVTGALVVIPITFCFVFPLRDLADSSSSNDIFNAISKGIIYFICLMLVSTLAYFFFFKYKPLINKCGALEESGAKDKQNLEEENSKNGDKIQELENRLAKLPTDYPRFENIRNTGMASGYINYPPYFEVESGGKLAGIGVEVLKSIFSIFDQYKLEYIQVGAWIDILSGLRSKKYDVVATPLYETRTRLYHDSSVAFCLPLFYAEIGLYVRSGSEGKKSLTEFSAMNNCWNFAFIKDEVSETMMNKLCDPNESSSLEVYGQNDAGYIDLLKSVVDNQSSTNVVAMEVFKAEKLIADNKLSLMNTLKAKQILYPVSFAVRKEDTALRNFINLRIIELLSGGRDNELQKIIQSEGKRLGFDAKSIFIHHYEWELL